ncbi:MAG: hypothetical protein II809_06180, partial [Bacteroidales bacterium]|nr:hypothetical protein [Bacteroidales bacterium]
MKKLTTIAAVFTAALLTLFSCTKPDIPQPKTPTEPEEQQGQGGQGEVKRATEPAECSNRIVAHRGGARESGNPD